MPTPATSLRDLLDSPMFDEVTAGIFGESEETKQANRKRLAYVKHFYGELAKGLKAHKVHNTKYGAISKTLKALGIYDKGSTKVVNGGVNPVVKAAGTDWKIFIVDPGTQLEAMQEDAEEGTPHGSADSNVKPVVSFGFFKRGVPLLSRAKPIYVNLLHSARRAKQVNQAVRDGDDMVMGLIAGKKHHHNKDHSSVSAEEASGLRNIKRKLDLSANLWHDVSDLFEHLSQNLDPKKPAYTAAHKAVSRLPDYKKFMEGDKKPDHHHASAVRDVLYEGVSAFIERYPDAVKPRLELAVVAGATHSFHAATDKDEARAVISAVRAGMHARLTNPKARLTYGLTEQGDRGLRVA